MLAMTRVVMACGQADVELDCFAGARNDEAWQADVLGCFVGNGDDIRTLDWIASRFRASTLAMTGGVYLGFNGLSVIFINKCVLMWVCHCELGRMTSEAIQKKFIEWF